MLIRRVKKAPLRAAILIFLAALLLAAAAVPALAQSGDHAGRALTGELVLRIGEDAYIGPEEVVQVVVVVGGDAVIEGAVTGVVVVVGGDVDIRTGAFVGSEDPGDASVVVVGGSARQAQGSEVTGQVVGVNVGSLDTFLNWGFVQPFVSPFTVPGIIGWAAWTVLFLLVAVFVAGVMPRQLLATRRRMDESFFASLGWGLLGLVFFVPIITVSLVITIVGILVAVPWLVIVLPFLSLFAAVTVSAWLGDKLFGRSPSRSSLVLTTVVGVVVIALVRLIPWGGWIITGFIWIAGFGATYVAILAWFKNRSRKDVPPCGVPAGPPSPVGPSPGAPPESAPPAGAMTEPPMEPAGPPPPVAAGAVVWGGAQPAAGAMSPAVEPADPDDPPVAEGSEAPSAAAIDRGEEPPDKTT